MGPAVQHTLIARKRESVRRPIIIQAGYDGGVTLLKDLLWRIAPQYVTPGDIKIIPTSQEVHTFAECRTYPSDSDKTKKDKKDVWRIDRLVGQTDVSGPIEADLGNNHPDLLVVEVPYVIDEAGVDISPVKAPLRGKLAAEGWVVVKAEAPNYIGSPLADSINLLANRRQIIIMSLSTVQRRDKTLFAGALSWEATADAIRAELSRQLFQSPKENLRSLDSLPHWVVVSIMNDGAACFRCDQARPMLTLIYDPKGIGGEWMQARPGRMPGHTQCLTAAVAAGIAGNVQAPRVEQYVRAGIHGGRKLHEVGYDLNNPMPFPVAEVAAEIRAFIGIHNATDLALPSIHLQVGQDEVNWSILKRAFSQDDAGQERQILGWPNVRERMFSLVKKGIDECFEGVPAVPFGDLTAVLREEIEGLRTLRGLMGEYGGRISNKRPLSVAVFGAPGSGKSFGVKSVAKSIRHRREFETLEFNLSQFSAPKQLYAALHQVRDSALSGKMPLVFWDEFDCDFNGRYGWLRYFLAPMWDGKFTEGQTTHSVGNAVFVFAGGTSHTVQTFREDAGKETAAKGPDFLSRLHGFLNVAALDHADVLLGGVLVRRAVLLRKLVADYTGGVEGRDPKKILEIDDSVVTAFLCVPKFRYGARSMEAILSMSSLQGKNRFEPSCLPPIDQIDLHVDSSEWLSLLQEQSSFLANGDLKNPLIGW